MNTQLLSEISAELHKAEEEMWNESFKVEGWSLRNIPKISRNLWDELINLLGLENYRICTCSQGDFKIVDGKSQKCKPWIRGYILISPRGMEKLKGLKK